MGKNNDEEKLILNFIKLTAEGKYTPIDNSSFRYIRVKEETEETDAEEKQYYYYGIR